MAANETTHQYAKNSLGNWMKIDINNDGQIQTNEALQVYNLKLTCYGCLDNLKIISLEGILNFTNIVQLNADYNNIVQLNLQNLQNLQYLYINNNLITDLNIQLCTNLKRIDFQNNFISNINFNNLTNLEDIYGINNQLTNLILNTNNNLKSVTCNNNFISNINVQGLNQLNTLIVENNQLTNLYLIGLNNLNTLRCSNNQLTTLNLKDCYNLTSLSCQNNNLNSLFIKNGKIDYSMGLSNNPNLQYICCDDFEYNQVQNSLNQSNITNFHLNSYCTFLPGGIYYTVQGNNKYDNNNNGCDNNDPILPNLKYNITNNGNLVNVAVSNTSGNYNIPLQAGTHTITPQLENPSYFNVIPNNFQVTFPATTSPHTQNFCFTPVGNIQDLEVVFAPTGPARPGFDAKYTLMYKNKGNQVINGSVTLSFQDEVLDLISSSVATSSQQTNQLTWAFTNLQPFETRNINLIFNVNSPQETPAVNIGNQLNYVAIINPIAADVVAYDNTSSIKQIVVGSYDPNDKTCVQGANINPADIGKYVNYVIRFENTGNFPAQNVVVVDNIDTTKFEINTLIPLYSSHNFVTKISNTNKVEFIFEGINLPFDDANNDGYIIFKIKSKSTLTTGAVITNKASIYFDYNFPIITNTATSTFQILDKEDFQFNNYFNIYPNPAINEFYISNLQNQTINSIEIFNLLGQKVKAIFNPTTTIDINNLQSGQYMVKVNTEKGSAIAKLQVK